MKRMVIALLAASAGACASVLPDPAPAPRIFPLRAAPEPSPRQVNVAGPVISVAPPLMSTALSGQDIVWVRDGEIAYMERSVWASRAPDALQALLVETIDRQDIAAAGIAAGTGVRADSEVRWSVVDFQIEEDGQRLQARFRADVKLMDPRSRRIVASLFVDETEGLAERSASQAASALSRTAQRGANAVGAWAAAQTPKADEPPSPQAGEPPLEGQPSAASITR
jgi:ABC-type uncharacterized transport system auxiliary subunit